MNESVNKKNTFCSGRGLEFGSQHTQMLVTTALGGPMPPSFPTGTCTHVNTQT